MKKTFEFTIARNAEVKIEGNRLMITCDSNPMNGCYEPLIMHDAKGTRFLRFTKNGNYTIHEIK